MGLRSTVSSLVFAPLTTAVEARLQVLLDQSIASRDLVATTELRALVAQVSQLHQRADQMQAALDDVQAAVEAGHAGLEARETASEERVNKRLLALLEAQTELEDDVEKLLKSIQPATAAIAGFEDQLKAVKAASAEANSAALGAKSSADKVSQRLSGLKAPKAPAAKPAEAKEAAPAQAKLPIGDKGCKVPGCTSKHRARGFCGKHYQQWKRGKLPEFGVPNA